MPSSVAQGRFAPTRRQPAKTRELLIKAAIEEFNTRGFSGTDTNRIARAAGFAPQAFYRHFADKLAIFLEVYERWWQAEAEQVGAAMRKSRDAATAARVVLKFHQDWKIYRRSLRTLTLEEPRIRRARAEARRRQALMVDPGLTGNDLAEKVGQLLTVERLCDASADGELSDIGISDAEAFMLVASAMQIYLARGAPAGGRPASPDTRTSK